MQLQIPAQVNVTVTEQDIEDICVTALEGGCNYWIIKVQFEDKRPQGEPTSTWCAKQLIAGKKVVITDDNSDIPLDLTLDKLVQGLTRFLSAPHQYPVISEDKLDCSNIDGEYADAIFQYALFEAVMYG